MTWILRVFPWEAILAYLVQARIGPKLWDIIKRNVERAEESDLPGHSKFATVYTGFLKDSKVLGVELGESLIRWAIETAVQLLKARNA